MKLHWCGGPSPRGEPARAQARHRQPEPAAIAPSGGAAGASGGSRGMWVSRSSACAAGCPGSDNGRSVNQPRPENPRVYGGIRRIDSLSPRPLRLEVGSNRPPPHNFRYDMAVTITVQWRAWPSRTPNANAGSGSAAPPASPSARSRSRGRRRRTDGRGRSSGPTPLLCFADSRASTRPGRDGLPESLAGSRTAELLEGSATSTSTPSTVKLPRGFGRD